MRTNLLLLYGLLPSLFLLTGCEVDQFAGIPERPDFNFDVKPLLSDRCYACHGPDETKQLAGLALHTTERAQAQLRGKPGQFAIVPGNPEASVLWKRINATNADLVMPPPSSHLSLNAGEKELLRRWIEQGAKYKEHWAFTAPQPVTIPKTKSSWPRNPIDHFVLQKHQKKGFTPAPEAEKAQLLRRVSFDLTGLPPRPEELNDFLNDASPDAYEKAVDRLLASPHYGERMATIWLDLSRYADSHGYQDDRPRSMWPWRDWVIRAYNDNLPYDKFITWQLAGDLLPNATYEQKLATGFNRNHPITQEGGIIPEEYLAEYVSDRTHVFSTAFLGLTVECAKCHTHKYDPILHEDYYQLTAFFNNIEEAGQIGLYDLAPTPNLPVEDPELEKNIIEVTDFINRLETTQRELEQSSWAGEFPEETVAEALNRGLVAHFNFDRNEGSRTFSAIPDQEPGWMNFNLPPTFGKVKETAGKTGKGLEFDGENYVSLGQAGDFDHYQAFSGSVWIKHNGKQGKVRALFGKRMDELRHNGYDLVLTDSNRLAFRLSGFWWWPVDYPSGLEAIEVQTVEAVPAGTWQHVAFTYDGSGRASGIRLFIGAQPQVQRTVADNLNAHTLLNGNHLCLGNWNQRGRKKGSLEGFTGGAIDEFRLYNRRLSPVELRLLTKFAPATAPEKLITPKDYSPTDYREHLLLNHSPLYQRNLDLLDSLRAIDRKVPSVMIMAEKDTLTPTFVRLRGEYDKLGEHVERRAPSALPPLPAEAPRNRLGLARWLLDPNHPLFARVSVNRLWQQIFGRGIVATPEDFGNQGALPSHPQLLDYLALHFRETGWDTKALLRLMVTSATYRQSPRTTHNEWWEDHENRWLSRGPNSKLTAEMIRDHALASSGLLNTKVGGKWVKPYQPPGLWNEMASDIGEPVYRQSRGQDLFRRSLYTYFKRTIPPPDMQTLDAADRAVCTVRRQQTSTPLQSLVVLNSPIIHEASRHLAARLLRDGYTGQDFIEQALLRIQSSPADETDIDLYGETLTTFFTQFTEDPDAAQEYISVGSLPVPEDIPVAELAAATFTVSMMYNAHETTIK